MNNFFLIFLIFLIIFNILICYNANLIANFFKIIDYPDKKRKIHSTPTPLVGGLIFFINIFLFFIFDMLTGSHPVTGSQFFFDIRIISIKQIAIFLIAGFLIYTIGFYDDIYDVKPFRKILFFLLILYILILSNPNFPIRQLQFFNLENNIYFNNFSAYLTLFCILAFMNAANMFDGVNLQSSILYSSFLLIFFLKGIDQKFLLIFLIGLVIFTYMNMKGKIFLGNNGSYFLSLLISIIIITDHNWNKNYYTEEIFLYLMIPGIDMIRLTIIRFINNKSPFEGDDNHLHHLLIKKFNYKNSIAIIFVMIFTPIILYNFFEINPLILIILSFIIYLTILLICLKKNIKRHKIGK
jgi:UDP-GlcNAc:undecaprenyl-phosphate GlcNAc-1-phosphate transferase